MAKDKAGEIAAMFEANEAKSPKPLRCSVCKMPEDVQAAIVECVQRGKMSLAGIARQARALGHKTYPQAIAEHYSQHRKAE